MERLSGGTALSQAPKKVSCCRIKSVTMEVTNIENQCLGNK
jgi:hypothetical protein